MYSQEYPHGYCREQEHLQLNIDHNFDAKYILYAKLSFPMRK